MFSEDVVGQGGLLQRIDPRVKFVSMLALLVAAGLARNIPTLLGHVRADARAGRGVELPVGFFVKRVWLFVPIFTGIVVLPATLSVVTHGHVVLTALALARPRRGVHLPGPDVAPRWSCPVSRSPSRSWCC